MADRFLLERMLGQGGMGSVWLARHTQLEVPCAVKFIEGENGHNEDLRARFAREAKAAAQLRSPHVVQILDHGVWQDTPYIAMELLEGEDLGQRLEREQRLTPTESVNILLQVSRALMKAHAAGIVHRDLKPDNIFLHRDDDREIVKILDFGIAKFGPNVTGLSSNTKTGSVLGTPYYMSPEQAQGAKDLDFRTDIWSIAVIAYECIVGERPFDGEALGQVFVKIIASPLPIPTSIAADLPEEFDAWWARAASRNIDERFGSVKELVDALASCFGIMTGDTMSMGRGSLVDVSLPVPRLSGETSPGSRTNTGVRTASAPDSVAMSPRKNVLAQTNTTATVGPVAEVLTESKPPTSSKKALVAGGVSLVVVLGLVGAFLASRGDASGAATAPTPTTPTTPVTPSASAPPTTDTTKADPGATVTPVSTVPVAATASATASSTTPTTAPTATDKPGKPAGTNTNKPGNGKPKKPKSDLGF